jgi:hypothetical protein
MVVYDRENLIKKFHNDQASTISLKSNANSLINAEDIPKQTNKCSKLSSCCCICFRKSSSPRSSLPHLSSNHGSNIDHKQNGYLIYRFTNNNNNSNNHNNTTYGSHPNSPVTTPPTNSKRSIFCHPCTNSKKKLSNLSDEIYQYRRNYAAQATAEYQFRNDESPCYELKTLENSLSPLNKCQTRSFEQSVASKIRDLNTELSHSRQLKAAAVAAAAVSTTIKDPLIQNVRQISFQGPYLT